MVKAARRLMASFPASRFGRATVTIVAGSAAAQILVVAVSPLLTRLYTPSDYGAFAVIASLLGIVGSVACLSYDFAIPLPRSDRTAAHLMVVGLVATAVVTAVSGITLFVGGAVIEEMLDATALGPFIPLLAIGIAATGIIAIGIGWAIRTKAYSEIWRNRMTQSGTVVVVQLGLGWLGAGMLGLVVGMIAGSVAAAARLLWVILRRDGAAFGRIGRGRAGAAARRYRRFPLLSAPSVLLNNIGVEASLLLIVALYGTAVGGELSLALRMIALPVTLVSAALAQVYFAEAARLKRDHPTELRRLFWRLTRVVAIGSAVPFLAAAIIAPVAFGPVFGPEWVDAGYYVAILAPMYFLAFTVRPTAATVDILERQDLSLVREISRLVFIAAAILTAIGLGLGPVGAIAALSAAGCATYLLFGFLSWRAINRFDAQIRREREQSGTA